MQNTERNKRIRNGVEIAVICLLCAVTVLLDFVKISYSDDDFYNRMVSKIVQQCCGSLAAICIMLRMNIRLFGKVEHWIYLLPCLIIAIDNFQFSSYFNGRMELARTKPVEVILFIGYCLSIGLFEELVFRGIIFSVLADYFSKDKKGFLKTYVISSVIFGISHLFNGFSVGTLLQVAYTTLTGGLFAFCLIKTKNVFCCAFIHGLYNFCGLLFDKQGLGMGVVFDVGTVITMLVVSVAVGVFVLYKTWKYSDEERKHLYDKLGVRAPKKTNKTIEEQ